jgi:predicted RNA binding protein YcfA (HicA-like mRNA interferase family)
VKATSGRELGRILQQHGWTLSRVTGSHHIYTKAGIPAHLSVPVHGNKSLKAGTLRALLKAAGLTESDL